MAAASHSVARVTVPSKVTAHRAMEFAPKVDQNCYGFKGQLSAHFNIFCLYNFYNIRGGTSFRTKKILSAHPTDIAVAGTT